MSKYTPVSFLYHQLKLLLVVSHREVHSLYSYIHTYLHFINNFIYTHIKILLLYKRKNAIKQVNKYLFLG